MQQQWHIKNKYWTYNTIRINSFLYNSGIITDRLDCILYCIIIISRANKHFREIWFYFEMILLGKIQKRMTHNPDISWKWAIFQQILNLKKQFHSEDLESKWFHVVLKALWANDSMQNLRRKEGVYTFTRFSNIKNVLIYSNYLSWLHFFAKSLLLLHGWLPQLLK